MLAAAVAPEAGPLTRAAGVGVISGAVRAEWARQKGEREAERVAMIDRLTELDTLAAGTPEKRGASGGSPRPMRPRVDKFRPLT